jgi:hypothetical protein
MLMRFEQRVSSRGAVADGWRRRAIRVVTILLIVLMCSDGSSAYSVLTHEEIVDLLWTDAIQPLLLKRYPALSADQIPEVHAYAYGGAVIQDLGYYPFGNREFSKPGALRPQRRFCSRVAAREPGRLVLFKTISKQEYETRSDFRAVPVITAG